MSVSPIRRRMPGHTTGGRILATAAAATGAALLVLFVIQVTHPGMARVAASALIFGAIVALLRAELHTHRLMTTYDRQIEDRIGHVEGQTYGLLKAVGVDEPTDEPTGELGGRRHLHGL